MFDASWEVRLGETRWGFVLDYRGAAILFMNCEYDWEGKYVL